MNREQGNEGDRKPKQEEALQEKGAEKDDEEDRREGDSKKGRQEWNMQDECRVASPGGHLEVIKSPPDPSITPSPANTTHLTLSSLHLGSEVTPGYATVVMKE